MAWRRTGSRRPMSLSTPISVDKSMVTYRLMSCYLGHVLDSTLNITPGITAFTINSNRSPLMSVSALMVPEGLLNENQSSRLHLPAEAMNFSVLLGQHVNCSGTLLLTWPLMIWLWEPLITYVEYYNMTILQVCGCGISAARLLHSPNLLGHDTCPPYWLASPFCDWLV